MKDEALIRQPRWDAKVVALDLSRRTAEIHKDLLTRWPTMTSWELENDNRSGWVYRGADILAKLAHYPSGNKPKLTKAQVQALRHIAEQMAYIKERNVRWPSAIDFQTPGAWGGTQELRSATVAILQAHGLVVSVERTPGTRYADKYALTLAGQAFLQEKA